MKDCLIEFVGPAYEPMGKIEHGGESAPHAMLPKINLASIVINYLFIQNSVSYILLFCGSSRTRVIIYE